MLLVFRQLRNLVGSSTLAALHIIPAFGGDQELANISTRGLVGSGDETLVGGFVLESSSNVLIRGIGPSLAGFGVVGTIQDPCLELFDASGNSIAANIDLRLAVTGPNVGEYSAEDTPAIVLTEITRAVGAFTTQPEGDAGIYTRLKPGAYTVQLTSLSRTDGTALLEVYNVKDSIDPFLPEMRVLVNEETGYAPTRTGFAPTGAASEWAHHSLVLEFDQPITWQADGWHSEAHSEASLTWRRGKTGDVQRGRAGAIDSRGWATSPRYTKTDPDNARVETLVVVDAEGRSFREEIALAFLAPGSGTFAYQWGSDEPGVMELPSVSGEATGTFFWEITEDAPAPETHIQFFRVYPENYIDGRSEVLWGLRAKDHGRVLLHGDGPDGCDANGAREVVVTAVDDSYVMHYDGCAATGWLACRAVSSDLVNWQKQGPIMAAGPVGSIDAGCVCSPWTYLESGVWHMFYLATPEKTPPPWSIPTSPYYTRKATAPTMLGPWTKQAGVVPFNPQPGTYYSHTASPGPVLPADFGYTQIFSAGTHDEGTGVFRRTLGLATTNDLNSSWTVSSTPLLPLDEQVENASLYFESANDLWFLFTNHVGISHDNREDTDAVWVYWSADPTSFNPAHKAMVMDTSVSSWARGAIGMPSVVKVGDKLALFYDGNADRLPGHMKRDIGLAYIDLPLWPPATIGLN